MTLRCSKFSLNDGRSQPFLIQAVGRGQTAADFYAQYQAHSIATATTLAIAAALEMLCIWQPPVDEVAYSSGNRQSLAADAR